VQAFTQVPLTHFEASGFVHCAFDVHAGVPPPPLGLQTPLSQVKPAEHAPSLHGVRHWPSAHTLPPSHSLENWQVFFVSVHVPAMHACPAAQSAGFVHAQGPAVPPHASHTPPLQVWPAAQSAFVVQSFFGPGLVPGGVQRPSWHTSPRAQLASDEQVDEQPVAVQTEPAGQLDVPVQEGRAGGLTVEQPYASHS